MDILELKPVFKDYIWGGTRLKDDFGFETDLDPVAEGWMLSCRSALFMYLLQRLKSKLSLSADEELKS